MKNIFAALLLVLVVLQVPQSIALGEDSATEVNIALIDSAVKEAEANTKLTDEQRSQLLDSYRRTQGYIKSTQSSRSNAAGYKQARKTAAAEATEIQKSLEKALAAGEQATAEPDAGLGLDEVEQLIQRYKAELAAEDGKASDLASRQESETGRPAEVRTKLAENTAKLADVAAQQKLPLGEAELPVFIKARDWLLVTQADSLRASSNMLEEELLSQPLRLELMVAQRDRARFEISRLQEVIKVYELHAVKLRQDVAAAAQVEVESAQADAEGKDPLIVALAQRNTDLSAGITERTTELEGIKSREALANEEAQTLERDLEAMQRKLDVLGMSQALGRVLREQQLRLPQQTFSRADISQRDKLISAASLRQFEYEDERRDLRSLKVFVNKLLSDVAPEDADKLRKDLTDLARTRRELVGKALDVEATYLRALGDLDFAGRRQMKAVEVYREFISERLLWIRTAAPLSLATFKPIPHELANLLAPAQWLAVVTTLLENLLGSPLYPLLLLVVGVLLRYRSKLFQILEDTGDDVGSVDEDKFLSSFQALGWTALLSLAFPLLVFTLGLPLLDNFDEGTFEYSVGFALTRISYYYLGLEFVRCLMCSSGLVIRHFLWGRATVAAVDKRVRDLTLVLVPTVFLAVVSTALQRSEGQSTLASFLLIATLLAISRFYAGFPNILEGQLDQLLKLGANSRRSFMGVLVRYFLVVVPLLLVACILLGYSHTAIKFLQLLLMTNALVAALLLLHEFGVRWLRILRRRLIKVEREEAIASAAERAEHPDAATEAFTEDLHEPDPEALDDEGRKLLSVMLVVAAVFGIWGVWAEVLPALAILDSVSLWYSSEVVAGVETKVAVTLADLGVAVLVGFAGYVATMRIPALLEIVLRQKMEIAAGTVYASITLFRYALITVVVATVLGHLGAAWGQIQWAVAALSVGIGFGLQEIVANFISGLILLFEQPIRVGDTVTVGETSGIVTRIQMRATTIRDWDRRELLVPNKEFITGRLLNWSLSDKLSRVVIEVGVAYGTNLKLAMELALQVAHEHPDILEDPAAFVTFDEFGDNSLTLRLRAYMADMDRRLGCSSELRLAIDKKYNEAGIVVAFPQRDVHLDTSAPLDVHIRNLTTDIDTE
jgi:potassium efflux system protein